ncbi:RNA polymerase sigma factor, partial [Emergencia timonensis]
MKECDRMNIREFEEKYDQYKTVIYRIAFTYLKNNEECEDAMQEVFLKYL